MKIIYMLLLFCVMIATTSCAMIATTSQAQPVVYEITTDKGSYFSEGEVLPSKSDAKNSMIATTSCAMIATTSQAQPVVYEITTDKGSYFSEGEVLPSKSDARNSITVHYPTYPKSGKAADLYNDAFKSIKQILQAEKNYFKKNKEYTSDISKLNLSFSNAEIHSVNNTSRIYLDNGYYFVLTGTLIAVYYGSPKNYEEWYHIDFGFDGTVSCIAKSEEAGKICEKLGGSNPTPNERIHSWIIYTMPDDFTE